MFKFLGRFIFKLFDIEIRYRGNWKKEQKWLIDYDFNTIIDIGANIGQFAKKMRKFFPKANIISFEPIPDVYEELNRAFKYDKKFKAYCLGLSDAKQTSSFFVNDDTASSSLLKMKNHAKYFQHNHKEKEISIEINRLDDIINGNVDIKKPLMIKIDVQGLEDSVIKGGIEIFKQADLILTEVSYCELYENQKLFDSIYDSLTAIGFKFMGNYEQLYSPINNMIVQADAIFIKTQ